MKVINPCNQETQVTIQLGRLSEQLNTNQALIEDLYTRLEKVLKYYEIVGQVENCKAGVPAEQLVPLAEDIRLQRMTVENSNDILQNIMNKLEL